MKKKFSPESLMMSYGYKPKLSQGAIKCPVFLTSTFAFESAEAGKEYFELAYGLREPRRNEEAGLIYSRLNNPDMEILEDRLTLWDDAEACAAFESGMSAISTVMMEFLKPGDLLLFSNPVYGGTHHFIHHFLPKWGIETLGFRPDEDFETIEAKVLAAGGENRLAMVYVETPANPTNDLIDLQMCRKLADRFSSDGRQVIVTVDNTYMGPVWQNPLHHGANLILYSATKYIGGHSDVIAGAVLGNTDLIGRVKTLRTFLGNMISPHTGWLLLRSLETLKLRMDKQADSAEHVAEFLLEHPAVEKIYYAGYPKNARQQEIFNRQCKGKGAMISFDIRGGEAEAFAFLNNLKLIKLAVSLGGTESLAEHPFTMTHADVPAEEKEALGLSEKMIRLSVGVENPDDLIADLGHALKCAQQKALAGLQ